MNEDMVTIEYTKYVDEHESSYAATVIEGPKWILGHRASGTTRSEARERLGNIIKHLKPEPKTTEIYTISPNGDLV